MRYLLILLAVLCVSCGTALPTIKPYKLDVQQGNVVTSKMLLQLRPGMTKSQVRFVMGTPLIQDSFHGNRWDYVYQLREQGKVTEQRRVILDFESDLLKTVRGDVIPKGSEQVAENVNIGVRAIESNAKPQEKSILEKLKFWKSDKAEAAVVAPATASTSAGVAKKIPEVVATAPLVVVPEVEVEAPKSVLVQDVKMPAEPPVVESSTSAPVLEKAATVAAVTPVASVDSNAVVLQAVSNWAEAWRTKNINQYLGFYADKFKSDAKLSKKNWIAQRKQRLSGKQGDISLVLEDIQVQVNGNSATVRFFQKYSSKVYSDQVGKVLSLEFDQNTNRWLIVKESAVVDAKRPAVQEVLAPEGTSEHLDGIIEKIGF